MSSDYSEWIDVQKTAGGLPANFIGYCAMSLVKTFAHHDLRNPNLIDPSSPAGKYLDKDSIPNRPEERPLMHKWPVPQRQVDQIPSESEYEMFINRLERWIKKQADAGNEIKRGKAFDSEIAYYLEGHELFHIHPHDKSLHCMPHHSDSKLLVEKGWAEWFGLTAKVSQAQGCVLQYAARTEQEQDVLEKVWDSIVAFVVSEKIKH